MSLMVMVWVMKNSDERLGDRLVLLTLAEFSHDDGAKSFPGVATIAARTRLSERQVQRCLQRLQEHGAIVQTGTTKTGTAIFQVLMKSPEGGDILSKSDDRMSPDPLLDPSALTSGTQEGARAQQITAYYVDQSRLAGAEPMRRMIGSVAQQVGELLDKGYEPIVVSGAIDKMIAQRLNPTALSSLAYEVKLGPKAPPSRTAPASRFLCPVCPSFDLRSASRLGDHIHNLHPELELSA